MVVFMRAMVTITVFTDIRISVKLRGHLRTVIRNNQNKAD